MNSFMSHRTGYHLNISFSIASYSNRIGSASSVREKSAFICDAFRNAKGVKSVSGMGLMLGIETEKPAGEIVAACRERGVICLTAKNKVRLLPALNIPMEQLEKAIQVLKDVIEQ